MDHRQCVLTQFSEVLYLVHATGCPTLNDEKNCANAAWDVPTYEMRLACNETSVQNDELALVYNNQNKR